MKKAIFLFITIVSVVNLSAQTHSWTFAKDFGGMTGNAWDPNNVPHHMEMDSQGNVYIFGTYGQMMSIDTTYLPVVSTDNTRASFLAKFNCQGDLQWTRAVNCKQRDVNANWMQIKDDTIYIMGDLFINDAYFLDTMVYANQLTYPYSFPWILGNYYNYFTKLDLDGNILETRLLLKGDDNRFWYNNVHATAPFYISNFNNAYFLGSYEYVSAVDDYDNFHYKYYIDTIAITDIIYFELQNNYLLFKFNSNMAVQWHKPIIDSVYNATRFRFDFYDMVADSDDNMYYVGKAQITYNDSTDQSDPPGTIYLADGHSIEFQEHGKDVGFVMKIDSAGTIQWVEQMYRETDTTVGGGSQFLSIDIDQANGILYISGNGNARNYQSENVSHNVFPNGDILESPCFDCSGTAMAGYLIAFNKENGDMLWHSTPYTEGESRFIGNVDYANDSLYVGLKWAYALHFQDTV
ncbi:MAG: hypothetical protein ACOC3T_05135, partial [Bacteroidota bacterium]